MCNILAATFQGYFGIKDSFDNHAINTTHVQKEAILTGYSNKIC